jgi:hypothetical protein
MSTQVRLKCVPEKQPKKASPEDAEELRQAILSAKALFQSAVSSGDKDYLRELHRHAKAAERMVNVEQLLKTFRRRADYFKPGYLISPHRIQPSLRLVQSGTLEDDLYKISRAFWSMPYSKGYGRRLRYVVFDEYHESVMGIIGLQSPPADLACRDALLKLPADEKLTMVNATLDAYTIGAIPPYSNLLAGKLVAGLVASDTVRRDYWRIYGNRRTLMQDRLLPQPLMAVTTTSAFGRSSIYNRLRFGDRTIAEPIGYTKGYGTIHLETLYPRIADWLTAQDKFVSGGYGVGPKVRWQNICNALSSLGLPNKLLEHGLQREVFLFRHVRNLEDVCATRAVPDPILMPVDDWAKYWQERWAIPRALREHSWLEQDTQRLMEQGIRGMLPAQEST